MQRNTTRSHTPDKISIKQLAATTVSPINNPNICYNSVPFNHISSQSSVSVDPYFPTLNHDKPRRRKIFQKKYLKGTVIPQQSIQYINSRVSLNNPKNVQSYYTMQHYNDYHHQNQQQGNQDYLSFENNRNKSKIKSSRTNPSKQEYHQQYNQNPPIFRNITQLNSANKFSNSAGPPSNFYLLSKNNDHNNSKNKLEFYSAEQHHQRIHSSKNCSNQKLPSFANAQNYHTTTLSQKSPTKANLFPHINQSQIQKIRQLSDIPEQVKKLKNQMLIHKKQLDQLNNKIIQNNTKTNKKEKQLLQTLIVKQKQLTQKQQQINQNLQKMAKIQVQSNSRYEQLLKNQLQLQRAKRVQQLMKNNERLQQELLKNQTKFIQDVTAESRRIKNNGITMNNYSSINPQYVSYDCSPLNPHYLQNYSQHTNVGKYFGEQHNFKQISALSNKYHIDQYEMSGDNTIRQLLSPLQIKPDYDL